MKASIASQPHGEADALTTQIYFCHTHAYMLMKPHHVGGVLHEVVGKL